MQPPRNILFRYLDEVTASAADIEVMEKMMKLPIEEANELVEDDEPEEREDHGLEG